MTTYITAAIVADTADEAYFINTGVTVSAAGPVIDASAAVSGRSFTIIGTLNATSGTAMLVGDAGLADSATSIKVDDLATFSSNGAGIIAVSGGITFVNIGEFTTSLTGLKLDGDGNSIENDDRMISSAGSAIISEGNGDVFSNNDASGIGLIKGALDAVVLHGKAIEFTNNARIVSTGGHGLFSDGAGATITNNFTINAFVDGIASSGNNAQLINNNQITSQTAAAIRSSGDNAIITSTTTLTGKTFGVLSSGDGLLLTNNDVITSSGVALKSAGDNAIITNLGTLTGDIALVASGDGDTITNRHTIEANSKHAAAIEITSHGETAFTNRAEISAESGLVLESGKGAESVLNTGSLFGDVRLDAGDDWFSCLKGQVTGTVYGGKGNDIYVAGSGLSFKENAGEGTDTVQSTISWALGANFENLTLAGNDKIDAVGNRLDNVISGNSAANHLTGAGGADIFVFTEGSGHDVVDDFHHGIDKLDLSAISGLHNFADIKDLISEKHGNAVIDLSDIAGGTTISLHHIDATVLNAADFIFD